MDDLDDMLDEAEMKFCPKISYEKKHTIKKPVISTKLPTSNDSQLDDILNEIMDDKDTKSHNKRRNYSSEKSVKETSTKDRHNSCPGLKQKCQTIYLNSTTKTDGISTAINKRSCDRLRCTECDFKIVSFVDQEWSNSVDYLFLRNNAPDFEKLKDKLLPSKGKRAYCCQCRHYTGEILQKCPVLKWVCTMH